jgi:putative NADPH-quinone reductase
VRRLDVGKLDFPLVRSRSAWETGEVPPDIRDVQEMLTWSEHIVILFPFWLGDIPAVLKALFEQVMRPGFAFGPIKGRFPEKKLKGRTVRIIVTMGMPSLFYRTFYHAHSVKSLERNILKFTAIKPVGHLLVGNVEGDVSVREHWLREIFLLSEAGL